MFKKSKGFFKRAMSAVLSATCMVSGLALAGTIASTAPVYASAASSSSRVFSWDNATVYFLLTDRFKNGNTSNDHAYGRGTNNGQVISYDMTGSFMGGDFAGITEEIKAGYFDDLGVNAIWLSAPYEQIHGYCVAGDGDSFAHYSYHGYYVLDYTEPDLNFGTKAEFKEMVDTAHEHGIRIVMDIVMNHAGYNTIGDMAEFKFGELKSGWDSYYYAHQNVNNTTYHGYVNYEASANPSWSDWWGPDWIRCGLPGYTQGSGDVEGSLAGLPDFKTGDSKQVGIPKFLQTKWSQEGTLAAKQAKYGSDTVTGHISTWLAEWVEEFGVDGFRCDTAKHVEKAAWKTLKDKCVAALKKWRQNNPTAVGADWTDDFWMTGECFGHKAEKSDYYTAGGFDSMINFEFAPAVNASNIPGAGSVDSVYSRYANSINNDPGFNVLSYLASHDTTLIKGDRKYAGSFLLMLPGGIQIYYGDETNRPLDNSPKANADPGAGHQLRTFMNWDGIDQGVLSHWQKLGVFRNNHLSVGAGQHKVITAYSESTGYTFARTYSGNGVDDKVVVTLFAPANTTLTIDVSSVFSDGIEVTNFYDDTTCKVSGGKVSFNTGANGTVLIQEPDGEKGKVTVTHIDQDSGKTIKTETMAGLVGTEYTAQPLSQDGFKLAKTVGQKSGTYSSTPAEVTFYYTFDSDNYAYIIVKHLDAANDSELAESTTEVAKVGTTYNATPATIKDYEVDLAKSTNISGTVKQGTQTAIFKYNYVEPTNLKVHYYNSNGWTGLNMYAYDESVKPTKEFLGAWPGKAMTDEGNGWFVCEVPDTESATIIFNGSGGQEPAYMQPGYECSGEVFLKDGKQQTVSKVIVVHSDTNGKTLASETLKGMSGDSYTTSAKTFTGYTLKTTPTNASGTFGATTITVTYVYQSDAPVPDQLVNNSKLSPATISVGSSTTITGAASGGTPSYTYKYEYKKSSASSYTTLKDFSTSTTAKYTPAAAGTYNIKVTVKDSDNNTATKTLTLTVESTPEPETLTNNSKISATTVTLGGSVVIKCAASGGTTPYKYQVMYKKSSSTTWSTLASYSTTASIKFTPKVATTYNIKTYVKDAAATVKTKSFTVKVNPAPLTNKSTVSATTVAATKSITVTGAAAGGTSPYYYAAYYKKSTDSSYTSLRGYSTTKTITFTPKTSGTYTLLVKVKDNVGTVVNKSFTIKVTAAPLTNKSTISATSLTLGKSITITGAATGGTTPYQYAAYYKRSAATEYTKLRGLSTTKTITFKPSKVGTYNIKVYVKDAKGTTATKSFTVTAKAAALTNKTTLAATTATYGSSIKITGAASGGTTPYQYAGYYKKYGTESYTSFRSYSTTATMYFKAPAAGKYELRLKVKDASGTVANKDVVVTITSAQSTTALANNSFLSASTIKLGEKVTVTGKPSGGTTPYQYAFSYKKASSDTFTSVQGYSTNRIVEIKPSSATKYVIRVKIKDASGTMKSKDLNLTVTK